MFSLYLFIFEFICNFIQFTFILFVAFCHLVKRSQLRCCHYCLWCVRWLLLLCHATTNTLSKYKDRINAGQIVIETHTPRKYARYALFIEKCWLRSVRWSSARKKNCNQIAIAAMMTTNLYLCEVERFDCSQSLSTISSFVQCFTEMQVSMRSHQTQLSLRFFFFSLYNFSTVVNWIARHKKTRVTMWAIWTIHCAPIATAWDTFKFNEKCIIRSICYQKSLILNR